MALEGLIRDQPLASTSTLPIQTAARSSTQLELLQAELAVADALYAAYKDEYAKLRGELELVGRTFIEEGRPVWKDADEAAKRQQPAASDSSDAEDPAEYTDFEEEVLSGRSEADAPSSAPVERTPEQLLALEAACSAISQDDMEAQGAVATLCGRTGKYYLRGVTCTLGRSTESKGDVDVDLSREGPASKVCRRQAVIQLAADGSFKLYNMGRQAMHANSVKVPYNGLVVLPHLSLVEVGGIRLIFMVNRAAVQRVMRRAAGLLL